MNGKRAIKRNEKVSSRIQRARALRTARKRKRWITGHEPSPLRAARKSTRWRHWGKC